MAAGSITKQLDTQGRDLNGLYQSGNTMPVLPQAGTVNTDANNSSQSYAPAAMQIADKTTTTRYTAVDTGNNLLSSTGGASTAAVAAAAAAAAIKASAGRLHRVLVTTAGTASLTFYDNASAASGTILGFIPANAAAGTIYDLQMPAANGIWCASGTNTPAITVSYS